MSSFIPIVSSSPPPLDEVPSFNDEHDDDDGDADWDDFAGFSSHNKGESSSSNHVFAPIKPDLDKPESCDNNFNAFGNFQDTYTDHESESWADFGKAQNGDEFPESATNFSDFSTFQQSKAPSDDCDTKQHDGGDSIDSAYNKHDAISSSSPNSDDCLSKVSSVEVEPYPETSDAPDRISQSSVGDSGVSGDVSPGHKTIGSPATTACDNIDNDTVRNENPLCHNNELSGEQEPIDVSLQLEDRLSGASDEQDCENTEKNISDSENRGSVSTDAIQTQITVDNDSIENNSDNLNIVNNNLNSNYIPYSEYPESDQHLNEKSDPPMTQSSGSEHSGENIDDSGSESNSLPSEPLDLPCVSNTESQNLQTDSKSNNISPCSDSDGSKDETQTVTLPSEQIHSKEDTSQQYASLDQETNSSTVKKQSNDTPSDPTVESSSDSTEADEFEEFKDAESASASPHPDSNGSNQLSEPEDLQFIPVSVTANEESPLEPLDLKLPGRDTPASNDDWADDFDDFQDAAPVSDQPVDDGGSGWAAFGTSEAANDSPGDNWAAFSEAPNVPTGDDFGNFSETPALGDEDDFGDFGEADDFMAPPPEAPKPTVGSVNIAISASFPSPGTQTHAESLVALLVESIDRENLKPDPGIQISQQKPTHKAKIPQIDVNVWNNLKDINSTAALKYTWVNSHSNKFLLKSISIDTRNMLLGHKKQHVPIFYQQGVLEPSRGPLEPTPGLLPSPSQDLPDASPIVSTTTTTTTTSIVSPQDIPPAEFDWSSSGLTNPLDALQHEQEILEALDAPSSRPEPPRTLQPLETLLAGMNFTPTARPGLSKKNEETLSREAAHALSTLPDLSFMMASVLMFPLNVTPQE